MERIGFYTYLLLIISWFLHLTARFTSLGSLRFDLILVVVIVLIKVLGNQKHERFSKDDIHEKLKYLILTIIIITPFAEWPGSAIFRGGPNFIKAVLFYYFTVWFIINSNRFMIFLTLFVFCQAFRILEPIYLHVTQGYWGSVASMAGNESLEFMNRLSGAPSDIINPNGLAYVILTVIPFCIYLYKINILWKIFSIIIVPLALYSLLLTGSRSGLVGLVIMAVFTLIRSKVKSYYFVVCVMVAFIMVNIITDDQKDRFLSIISSDTKNTATAEGRLNGLAKDLNVGLKRPIFGYGLGSSLEANANLRSNAQPSHNLYIEVFQELGLIGLFMFVRYLWSISKCLFRHDYLVNNVEHDDVLLNVKNAFATLTITTLFFGFASYGLSSYEWYFIGGATTCLNNMLMSKNEPIKV